MDGEPEEKEISALPREAADGSTISIPVSLVLYEFEDLQKSQKHQLFRAGGLPLFVNGRKTISQSWLALTLHL